MALSATRTHTHFFGEDDLTGLNAEIKTLSEDWDSRREHVPEELRCAGDARLSLLRAAAMLLRERAD